MYVQNQDTNNNNTLWKIPKLELGDYIKPRLNKIQLKVSRKFFLLLIYQIKIKS